MNVTAPARFWKDDTYSGMPGIWSVVQRINSYKRIKSNAGGTKIGRVQDLEKALIGVIKNATNHWLFKMDEGVMLPYYVANIRYHPRDERYQTPAYVAMEMYYMERGDKKTKSIHWDRGDLRGGKTVYELLGAEELFMPTPEMIKKYEGSMIKYKALQPQVGAQFTAQGTGLLKGQRLSYWGNEVETETETQMEQEGVPDKLVMDDLSSEGGEFSTDSARIDDAFWVNNGNDREDLEGNDEADVEGKVDVLVVPTHPCVKLFNLDRHSFCFLYTDQLVPYNWTSDLDEKLILPDNDKSVIHVLMDTAREDMADIISGKSGGTIVICTGPPGTGKTLTAEVTSEVVQRPLYKVQCSQLGTDEEAIEKTLSLVLQRALRWGAILLIDEADVYVRKRGTDIQQNAIVGVFLRVLECYRGILFLTSNLADEIDDAIMSRSVAHIQYTLPSKEMLRKIWRVLSDLFKMNLDKAFIDKLVEEFPGISGRDVKNLLKLVARYCRSTKTKVDMKAFKLLAPHKGIKVKA